MKIVRVKATKRVIFMFNDDDEVIITEKGMLGKIRALDVKPATHEMIMNVRAEEAWKVQAMGYDTNWFIYDQVYYDELEKAQIQKEIDAKCDRVQKLRLQKTYSDVTMQFPDGSYNIIQFRDDFDRQNVSNLALGALAESVNNNPNKKIKFRDAKNKVHDIKARDLVGLALGVMDKKQRIVETAWAHKDTLQNLKTLEAVRKYNINEGWN